MFRREYLQSMIGAAGAGYGSSAAGSDAIRRLVEECLHRGNVDAADELLAPDYRCHGSFGDYGRHEWKLAVRSLRDHFGDLRVVLHEVLAIRDRVAVRWTLHATDAATGRGIQIDGINIERASGGRIVETHIAADLLPCLRRLGVMREKETV